MSNQSQRCKQVAFEGFLFKILVEKNMKLIYRRIFLSVFDNCVFVIVVG